MRPGFLIIGAQRCGTTSVYRYLTRHPGVAAAAAKEVHFFDLQHHLGPEWYFDQFPGGAALTGEASPYYLFHPLAAERAAALVPDAKIVILLRDPVARAISHYHHTLKREGEPLPLEDAIAAEAERLAGQTTRMRRDPGYHSAIHRNRSYLARGRYAWQIEHWREHFPSDQMLVLDSDVLFDDPGPGLTALEEFLGLEPGDRLLPRLNGRDYELAPPHVVELLRAEFAESDRRLAGLLGRTFSWMQRPAEDPLHPA